MIQQLILVHLAHFAGNPPTLISHTCSPSWIHDHTFFAEGGRTQTMCTTVIRILLVSLA